MGLRNLLVANRGEIAVRILRAAGDLGIRGVAIHSEDDSSGLHVLRADESLALTGRGATAYLDAEQIVARALEAGCDAVHPGYGFLSESAEFARLCRDAGLIFVGPSAEVLDRLGDKAQARALAQACEIPILRGTGGGATLPDAKGESTHSHDRATSPGSE